MSSALSRRNSGEVLIDDSNALANGVAAATLHEKAKVKAVSQENIQKITQDILGVWNKEENSQFRKIIGPQGNELDLFIGRTDWIYEKIGNQFYYYRITLVALRIFCPFMGAEVTALTTLGVYFFENKISKNVNSFLQPLSVDNTFASLLDKFNSNTLNPFSAIKRMLKMIKVISGIAFYVIYRAVQLSICAEISPLPLSFSDAEGKRKWSLDLRLFAMLGVVFQIFQERAITISLWNQYRQNEILSYGIPKKYSQDVDNCSSDPQSDIPILFPVRFFHCEDHWMDAKAFFKWYEDNANCPHPSCRKPAKESHPLFDEQRFIINKGKILNAAGIKVLDQKSPLEKNNDLLEMKTPLLEPLHS